MTTHTWIDEAEYFQREPTPAAVMERLSYWEPPANGQMIGVEAVSWEKAEQENQRRKLKNRRTREMENCQHGFVPYEIRWRKDVHPMGARIFYCNISGMGIVHQPLTEDEHNLLHDLRRAHEHIKTVLAPKD